MFRLRDTSRVLFKTPFGRLHRSLDTVLPLIRERTVYTVGDRVSTDLVARGIIPSVMITDGFTLRSPCAQVEVPEVNVISAENPAGCLTPDLFSAISSALSAPPSHIRVEGEEDLAVIPLVLEGEEGAVLLYGQPGEGVVTCTINEEARGRARELLAHFIDE